MSEPVRFDRFSLVLLLRPPGAPELPEEEVDALQEQHLAYLRELRERGAMASAGPFRDQREESLRGLCLYRTGLAEARELAEADPAVRAGRLAVEVLTWLVPAGEVRFGDAAGP